MKTLDLDKINEMMNRRKFVQLMAEIKAETEKENAETKKVVKEKKSSTSKKQTK